MPVQQTQFAKAQGHIVLSSGREDKLLETVLELSPTIRRSNLCLTPGKHNRHDLAFDFEYGPVWGCWASDVRKRVKAACRAAGTDAEVRVTAFTRTVLESRPRRVVG